ncbi:hypothetical protein Vretifemale_13553, partial [Volvox reticuliferus]
AGAGGGGEAGNGTKHGEGGDSFLGFGATRVRRGGWRGPGADDSGGDDMSGSVRQNLSADARALLAEADAREAGEDPWVYDDDDDDDDDAFDGHVGYEDD